MISFNSPDTYQQFHTGILVNGRIIVQAAVEVTDYNIQYLRRLLRFGALEGIKIGQIWLIEMELLLAYLERVKSTSDRRYGPR